jgi:hypothetical protein
MTNHLADELRGILAELNNDPMSGYVEITTRERLRALIAHVERLHAEPEPAKLSTAERVERIRTLLDVVVEPTVELTTAGLDPEQEIRARALDAVARLFTGAPPTMFGATELAEDFADWIHDGSRP